MRFKSVMLAGLERIWAQLVVPLVSDPLDRQRIKVLLYVWGYFPLIFAKEFGLEERLSMVWRFLKIDWNVLHAHLPSEIVSICVAMGGRREVKGEIMVEAGCWKGGSSAKFSILCKLVGARLWIFDSFEGVSVSDAKNEWEGFAGQYASPENVLWNHLSLYGEPSVCIAIKGWFSETLAKEPIPHPVRLVYIDCDLAKGTMEVMMGTVPSLTSGAVVFSQDFHIGPVRELLSNTSTWIRLGRGTPEIKRLGQRLAKITFPTGEPSVGISAHK